MSVSAYQEHKSVTHRKKRSSKKKQRFRYKVKRALHHLFSFLIVIFLFPALYFLIWGLMIEPNLPRHIYGPGDLKELIYLLVSLLIIVLSYLMIQMIKYKPLDMSWWNDLKLLSSVHFNLEKYIGLKRMGIKYHRKKKKELYQQYHHKSTEHKSIIE